MISGRSLRTITALLFSSWFLLGCSVSEQLQGYLGSINQKPALTLSHTAQTEGTSAQIDFTLSKALEVDLVVAYSTADGSAGVSDYTAASGNLTITAGQLSTQLTVATATDTVYEGSETFVVNITLPSEVTGLSQHTVTIADDDTPPVISFALSASTVAEDVGVPHELIINISGSFEHPQAAMISAVNLTTINADYTLPTTALTFASGDTSKTLALMINNDSDQETDETVQINFSSAVGGATIGSPSSNVVTIQDDGDVLAFLSISDAAGTEGASAIFYISVSEPSTMPIIFNWATSPGTATTPADFVSASGTFTLAPGLTSAPLPSISLVSDGATEGAEYFTVVLSSFVNAQAGDLTGAGAIGDATTAIYLYSSTVTNVSDTTFTVQLAHSGDTNLNSTSTLRFCDATAVPGCDPLVTGMTNNFNFTGTYWSDVVLDYSYVGHTFNYTVTSMDPDGVTGAPLTGVVTLTAKGTYISGVDVSSVTAADFTVKAFYKHDADNNGSMMLYYCNETDSPGCNPTTGSSLNMTRGSGFYLASINSLTSPHDPEDRLNFRIIITDAGGTSGDYNSQVYLPGAEMFLNGTIQSAAIQNDGKRVYGGMFTGWDNTLNRGIVLINSDGSENASFNSGEGFESISGVVFVDDAVYTSDRGLIAIGRFDSYNSQPVNKIVKLKMDGSIDGGFNTGTGPALSTGTAYLRQIKVQSDGKFILLGEFDSFNGFNTQSFVRLNSNGSVDTTFVGRGYVVPNDISLQPDNKIIASIYYTSYVYDGQTVSQLFRINTDGTIDTTFNIGAGANGSIQRVVVQTDNKIIIGGRYSTYQGVGRNGIARLNNDGSLDTTFNPGTGIGVCCFSEVMSINIQDDGKIVFAGENFQAYNGNTTEALFRVNSNGSFDTTFLATAIPTGSNVLYSVAFDSDGSLIVTGQFNYIGGHFSPVIAKVKSDGSADLSFSSNTLVSGYIRNAIVAGSHQYFAFGNLSVYGRKHASIGVARQNVDNSYDSTFLVGDAFKDPMFYSVASVAVDSAQRIYATGSFDKYSGANSKGLVRINSDGTRDTSFNVGTGVYKDSGGWGTAEGIKLQSDGKPIIWGGFDRYNGSTRTYIARLNTNGSLDGTFSLGSGFSNYHSISDVDLQSDGKILAVGIFAQYQGSSQKGIVRLNTNGTKDTSFVIGTGFQGTPEGVQIMPDGKIWVLNGGATYNSQPIYDVTRLNSDGSLDISLDIWTPNLYQLKDFLVLPDERILFGLYDLGYNLKIQGQNIGSAFRVFSDGAIDTSFGVPDFDNGVYDIQYNSASNSTYFVGDFTKFKNSRHVGYYEQALPAGSVSQLVSVGVFRRTLSPTAYTATARIVNDVNGNATGVYWYCNATDNPGCDPVATGISLPMVKDGSVLKSNVTLTAGDSPGDVLNVRVIASDPDGITGSPANSTFVVPPTVTVPDITLPEGSPAELVVSINVAAPEAITFSWQSVGGGSANGGNDFTYLSGTATISAGQTSVTLQAVPTVADAIAESAETFFINLTDFSDNVYVTDTSAQINIVDSINGLAISNLQVTNVTSNGFDVSVDYTGDANANSVGTLYWCSSTDDAGCDPLAGGSLVLTRGATTFAGSVTGLSAPYGSGETLKLRVVATDNGGVLGSPLSSSVTLGLADALTVANLTITNITNTSFQATVSFSGDDDSDSTATLYYCNHTLSPACDPATGTSVAMSRGAGVFSASSGFIGLPATSDDVFSVQVVATDPDTVSGSPLDTTVQLLPAFSVTQASVIEGGDLIFTANIDRPLGANLVFNYATVNHTAVAGVDYTSTAGLATILAGQTLVILPVVTTANDGVNEGTLKMQMQISGLSGAYNLSGPATGYIIDDDPGPVLESGFNGTFSASVDLSSGKALLSGFFSGWDNKKNPGLLKISPTGAEDFSLIKSVSDANTVVELPDGKLLLNATLTDGVITHNYISRINADGTLDSTFNTAGGPNGIVTDFVVRPDGKIVIVGSFTTVDGVAHVDVAVLNADGTRDASFAMPSPGLNMETEDACVMPDGRIVVTGSAFTATRVARVNLDGSIDTGFPNVGSQPNNDVYDVFCQPDGKVIIGGRWTAWSGTSYILRFNEDGTKDTGFAPMSLSWYVNTIAQQPDGKTVIGGAFTKNIARLEVNGAEDTAFAIGTGLNGGTNEISLQRDGKILAVGGFSQFNGSPAKGLVRLNSDGTRDATLVTDLGLNMSIGGGGADLGGVAETSSGSIVVVGNFSSYKPDYIASGIARMNAPASLDTTFSDSGGFGSSFANLLIKTPDNKIIATGSFTTYQGQAQGYITRMSEDGVRDTTFNVGGSGLNASGVSDAQFQDDGKLILSGYFSTYNGVSRSNLLRLNTDGTLDGGFAPGNLLNNWVETFDINREGKIFAGGRFTTYNAGSQSRLIAFNPDGSKDTTFDVGSGFDQHVWNVRAARDGGVFVLGNFSTYKGSPVGGHFIKLKRDGSVDTSFNSGAGPSFYFSSSYFDFVELADGKVVATINGTYDGQTVGSVFRINSDGTVDTTFNIGTGFNAKPWSMSVSSSGVLKFNGNFTQFDGQSVNYFKYLEPRDTISIGNLQFKNITQTSFDVDVGFYGDWDNDATSYIVKWCNQTDDAGCTPANDTPMARDSATSTLSASISGLASPENPGDSLKVEIHVADPDGAPAAPLQGTVQLAP